MRIETTYDTYRVNFWVHLFNSLAISHIMDQLRDCQIFVQQNRIKQELLKDNVAHFFALQTREQLPICKYADVY